MLTLQSPQAAAMWLSERVKGTLQTDSRQVRPGDGFLAWPGGASDGRLHVADAMKNGAVACLVEAAGVEDFNFSAAAVAAYPQLQSAAGDIAAAFFKEPSHALDVIAITGTNGKTTTAWWLAHALSNLEHDAYVPCALVGTLGVGVARRKPAGLGMAIEVTSTGLTTPEPVQLQRCFREFVDAGMRACAIEASSIGIHAKRLAGTRVRCAVFTNFTQDHLDYHGDMATYWDAKAALFDWPGLQSAVINIDDVKGQSLANTLQARVGAAALDVWTVSISGPARLQAQDISFNAGLTFVVVEDGGDDQREDAHLLATKLIGQYNVSNLLGVIAAMRSLGVPLKDCVKVCGNLQPVPGRMEFKGDAGEPLVAVDYAHTPDALAQALLALRPLAHARGGKLWCVFGCGGDRDPGKRPLMGVMAATYADRVLVTSDNPRSEKPQAIISQILLGLAGHGQVEVESDRARAIALVLAQAGPADVVLVAGKGHEDYQDIGGQKHPFSDLAHVQQALQLRAHSAVTTGEGT